MADKTPTSGMKYLFIAGGRRKGAGGPKSYEIEREMRQKRIWIPRAFMIDGKNGFQNDATFFPNALLKQLLNVAAIQLVMLFVQLGTLIMFQALIKIFFHFPQLPSLISNVCM